MRDFFISYAGFDQEWAEWIARQLEESGYSVFLNFRELRVGDDFQLTLSKAINKARFIIAIISRDYFAGEWTKHEWATVLESLTKEKNRLIPILVDEIDKDAWPFLSILDNVAIDLVRIHNLSEAKQRLLAGIEKIIDPNKQPERETDSPVKNEPPPEAMQSQGDINVEAHRAVNPALYPPAFPPPWANEWGEDTFGLYADLDFQGVIQRFRWIVPGTFLMGSSEKEPDRFEDEIQHPVTLTQGFWLADSACTQALWQALMGSNPSHFQGLHDNPVDQVSWDDVQHFLQVLNERLPDLEARLPTEAEWEYACRAGTTTLFSFGDNITPEQVNYAGDKTIPVKSLPSNPWGLYEMHGNVWEWCADWYGDYPTVAVVDPSMKQERRVLRGGSWYSSAWWARSASRNWSKPDFRRDLIGFRLALGRIKGASK